MKVHLTRPADPPEDVAHLHDLGILDPADGEWVRFHTDHGHALVHYAQDRMSGHLAYLVHRIEAALPGKGHGSSIMLAIGQFADRRRASGHLVCELDLVAWYERFDWQPIAEFNGDIVMARFYKPRR